MSKLLHTLELIRGQLDTYFQNADPRQEEWVVLANLVDPSGQPNSGANDRVVLFLAGITRETTVSTYQRTVPVADQTYAVVTPPLYVDLHLLVYANFYDRKYPVGLAMISGVLSFFQQYPYFNHQNLPDLDPSIEQLTFEIVNLGPHELAQVMALAGLFPARSWTAAETSTV